MQLSAWLQNEGAWIAIGVSVVFVLAGIVMHRVFLSTLKNPTNDATGPQPRTNDFPTYE
ncbi:MAG: hypothetical protein ACI9M6_001459 [Hydrogenophaga sp.]|jgi:hypothetical protein